MKYLLIDGNSLLYRVFYANTFKNPELKEMYKVTYSFVKVLRKAVELTSPDKVFVAFDKGKNTWRHKIYKDYKAGRRETPAELFVQMNNCKQFLKLCNIQVLESDEYEADDLVGSIAKQSKEECSIVTSDRDLLQLVDNNISVYIMKTGLSDFDIYTPEVTKEKYGVRPEQVPDFKGICGDKSDNIKGVNGIGEVGAKQLLEKYDNLENIYENIEHIKGVIKTKLEKSREDAFFSKQLATISINIPVDITEDKFLIYSDEIKNFLGSLQNNI